MMNTSHNTQGASPTLSAVFMVLIALLAGFGTPVFGQSDYDDQIEELEKALEEIKASIRKGEDVGARIEALEEELTNLKQEIAGAEPSDEESAEKVASGQSEESSASDQDLSATVEPRLLPGGVQGAPNPMNDNTRYLTGQDLLDEDFPNSIPIPGSKGRVAFGGYAKLDLIQDLDYVGDRYELELISIPVEGTPEYDLDGLTTLHAKETRFNVDFRRKAHSRRSNRDYPLQGFLEIDFFDDRDDLALQPRLRQAYGVLGKFLAGQTWNSSADLDAIPGTIDFAAGDALYGNRVAQIRWEDRVGEKVTWRVALEENKADIGNPLGFDGEDRPETPNLAGRVRWTVRRSHIQIGGDLFQLNWQGGSTGPSDTATAWGLNLTSRFLLGKNSNNALLAGYSFGDGGAHKVVTLRGSGSDAVLSSSGELETMGFWEGYLGYSHYWTSSLNSTISTAWTGVDNSQIQTDDAIHGAGSFHLNLIWFPYKLASTGFEIMWGERKNKGGARGDVWRLQYMSKFKFN